MDEGRDLISAQPDCMSESMDWNSAESASDNGVLEWWSDGVEGAFVAVVVFIFLFCFFVTEIF